MRIHIFSHKLPLFFSNLIKKFNILILSLIYLISICLNGLLRHSGIINKAGLCQSPEFGPITLYSTPTDIIQCFGGSDVASYVRVALGLQEHGLSAFSTLGFATWPPGFSVIELSLIKLNIFPLPLGLFLLNSILWAFVFVQLYSWLKQTTEISVLYAFAMPLLLLLIPFVSDFYLWEGMLWSESISTALFLIAILDLWRLAPSKPLMNSSKAIFIGFLFALAAYVRAQFDLIVHIIALAALFILSIYYVYFKRNRNMEYIQKLVKSVKRILLMFVVFQACILPYKVFLFKFGHGFAMANVSYMFESVWKKNDWYIKHGWLFLSEGGIHSMCTVDTKKCQEFEDKRLAGQYISIDEYKKAAEMVLLKKPFSFLKFKLPYFWKAWDKNVFYKKEVFSITLLFLIIGASIIRIIQNRQRGIIELAIFLAIFVGSTVFSFIMHFEPRYLLVIKIIGIIWVFTAFASIIGISSKKIFIIPIKFRKE